MIDRWKIDYQITELAASMLASSPVNSASPFTVGLPNPELKYPILKGRRLYECESGSDLQLYCFADDIKESTFSNCHYLCEQYVIVGIIRKKDTLIPDFNTLKSAITMFFGANGKEFMHQTLTDGEVTITDTRIGEFGIAGVNIQSTKRATDKCGICNFEALVKFKLYFNRFQQS